MSDQQTPTPLDNEATAPSGGMAALVGLALRLRFTNLIAVGCSFIGALCMSILGLIKTALAVEALVDWSNGSQAASGQVTAYVIQAMDAFLMSVVLVVFATGIFHLFISRLESRMLMNLSGFRIMSSISELKKIIAELIIVVLFVQFLKLALDEGPLDWSILTIPAGILMMAVSLRLLRFDRNRDDAPTPPQRDPLSDAD